MKISEKIKYLRTFKNLSQESLAEGMCVNVEVIKKWENDLLRLESGELMRLSRIFSVPINMWEDDSVDTEKLVELSSGYNDFISPCPRCEKTVIRKDQLLIKTNELNGMPSFEISKYFECTDCGVEWKYDTYFRSYSVIQPIGLHTKKVQIVNSKRNCCDCGVDITSQPDHHFLCRSCWEARYKPKQNNTDRDKSYSHDSYTNSTYNDYGKYESLRDAFEGDEDAYYNIYGEFPSEGDW